MNINSINNLNFGKIEYPYIGDFTKQQIKPYETQINEISKGKNILINEIADSFAEENNVPAGWCVSMYPQDEFSPVKEYNASIPNCPGLNLGEAILEAISKLSQIVK